MPPFKGRHQSTLSQMATCVIFKKKVYPLRFRSWTTVTLNSADAASVCQYIISGKIIACPSSSSVHNNGASQLQRLELSVMVLIHDRGMLGM